LRVPPCHCVRSLSSDQETGAVLLLRLWALILPNILISSTHRKYYMDSGELKVDLGCFVAGLEYSSQVQAEIVGKPSSVFFNQAAKMIGLAPGDLVMIGDDVEGDVGGALSAGFQAAVLVKTGKFRPRDANHPKVKPTFIADNLSHAVDVILGMK